MTSDDELLAKARKYTGIEDTSTLANEALKELIEREAARKRWLLEAAVSRSAE